MDTRRAEDIRKAVYEKPILIKYEQLREVTLSSTGKHNQQVRDDYREQTGQDHP